MKPLLIRNAIILSDPCSAEQVAEGEPASLLVQDGRISQIGNNLSPQGDWDVLEAQGLILTPGWIDIQLNGAFGFDFTEDPETIWQAACELPKLGTTSFLPTIISSPLVTIEHAIRVQKHGSPKGFKGANPLGLHLEGPFLNTGKKGAHNPQFLMKPSPDLVSNWTRPNGVLLVTLAPELDDEFATTHRLRDQGVVLSIGHSLATYEQACVSFQNGIKCGTHLFNAQTSIDHRKPGLAVALLNTPEVYTGVIVDGIHLHPAMVKLAWTSKGNRRLITVTDAISALGMPPGKYKLGEFEIKVTQTTVTLADGTLAGSNITQQKSLRNLIAWTSCTLHEAVQTVTANPAEMLNLPKKGRIITGADADLVMIDRDLNIKSTIVGGEILYKEF
jgi:N-acetylglucosamine-6-phosphate deacetylase